VSVIDKSFRKAAPSEVMAIPILVRLWKEDNVWNGEAAELSVAVFGNSFEETADNLHEAVISHLEALQEIGKLDETVHLLRAHAREYRLSAEELPSNEVVTKFNVGLQDHRLVCIA
jgi:predicted RNase H-like HicB family nuclease